MKTSILFQPRQEQQIVKIENEESDAISLNNEVYIFFCLVVTSITGKWNIFEID